MRRRDDDVVMARVFLVLTALVLFMIAVWLIMLWLRDTF